jgi:hypothetical protein
LLAASAVLAGCGGGGSDQAAVQQTLTTYLHALADGDGVKACSQLTTSEAIQFAAYVGQQDPQIDSSNCAAAISALSGSLGGDGAAKLRNATVDNVKVSGDSATADVVGGTTTPQLSKVAGRWFISGGLTPGG